MKEKLILILIAISCSSCFKPLRSFSHYAPPPVPDYAQTKNWAALPDQKDSADAVPLNSAEVDGQQNAKVDVFYIHPTLNFSGKSWNGDVNDKKLNKLVDKYPIRFQASVYNGSCKVYAPRYRQATLYSFVEKKKNNGQQALELAYQDVRTAFEYYLKNYNNGRPFIIAGHSQGSKHAYRLLVDYIEHNELLRSKLVAAYAIGMATDSSYASLAPCDSANQVGCLISWNTFRWGAESTNHYLGMNRYCTNPLTWTRDSVYVTAEKNFGGLDRKFRLVEKACDAKIQAGLLWIHKPSKGRFASAGKNFHVSDYNLFYMNLRKNVSERVNEYLKRQQQ